MCPDSILSHLAFQEYHLIFIEIPHFRCALYVTLKGLEIEKDWKSEAKSHNWLEENEILLYHVCWNANTFTVRRTQNVYWRCIWAVCQLEKRLFGWVFEGVFWYRFTNSVILKGQITLRIIVLGRLVFFSHN